MRNSNKHHESIINLFMNVLLILLPPVMLSPSSFSSSSSCVSLPAENFDMVVSDCHAHNGGDKRIQLIDSFG